VSCLFVDSILNHVPVYLHHSYVNASLREASPFPEEHSHMPITELKKLIFLLKFQERDVAALRRRRNPDADAIALGERAITQLRAKIARLTDAPAPHLRESLNLL
jgi:hypothetical protein